MLTTVFAVLFCSISLVAPVGAADYLLSQEVVDPSASADVCPNIPGVQTSIPSGMQLDGNGNCYTPTPPPTPVTPVTTPVTTDLCKNLSGTQTVLPSGYYRSGGNCYAQPTAPAEPVDVCSNLEAVQASIPDGYYLNDNNECVAVPAPVDECPNIDGPQAEIPEGMARENNVCYTPAAVVPNTDDSNKGQQNNAIKNLPAFLQGAVLAITSIIPDSMKQWLKDLPENTAIIVPYYVFLIVVILAIIPILQSIREALFARQIAALLGREHALAEEKDNFVALASHYLRTPLTLMNGGVDSAIAANEVTTEQVTPLHVELVSLNDHIRSILDDVTNNSALKEINTAPTGPETKSVWRSGWFWGPVIGSILLTLAANFLLVFVGEKQIGVTHAFFHFVVAAAAFIVLYLGVRNLHMKRKLRAENQLLVDHERSIDEARNRFIGEVTAVLQGSLERISQQRALLQNTASIGYFDEGYGRIEALLQKFLLLGQIQAGVEREAEAIDVHEAIENLLVTYHAAISAKRLTVTNATSPLFIRQNKLLFNFVLGSVIDNAIRFNQEGGTIEIGMNSEGKSLVVKVADNGIGIENDKLDQLFKPFSKTTSAVEFNYEGLGFSLFLDKIIMDYTGGDISVGATSVQGTELLIRTPLGETN
jgi:signal transduction histidine kinase